MEVDPLGNGSYFHLEPLGCLQLISRSKLLSLTPSTAKVIYSTHPFRQSKTLLKLEDEVTPNSEDGSEEQLYFLEELEPVIESKAHMASQMMAVNDLSAGIH